MGISSRVCLARVRSWNEALLMLAYLRLSRSWSYPLLGWASRLLGQPLGFLGLYRPKGKSSDTCPLCEKRVRSTREDKPSDVILVGRIGIIGVYPMA